MKIKKYLMLLVLSFFFITSKAQNPSLPYLKYEIPQKANKEFQFLAFYINQAVATNVYARSEFMKGQVVGRLFGGNTTSTSDSEMSRYAEQRLLPFFIYQPHLFNGKATLRASFELDWTWGDAAYGVGGNTGSAFSADQVNLQTQNLELELNPAKGWYINLGLQRLFDTPYNPYKTLFDKMTTTGYRLAFFGSDAVGISVRKDWDYARLKTGYYKLYENATEKNDDVTLFEANFEKNITKKSSLGFSAYYVADRASGMGGVSILGQGLNSLLSSYNGTYKFSFGDVDYKADVLWLGTYFGRNTEYMLDRISISGFVNANIGKADTLKDKLNDEKTFVKATDIFGISANLRAAYRYGQTANDLISLDLIYASGDANGISDGKYSGVMTGNTWGSPGAIFISSGSYLLMPHGNVVNRFTPAITDFSNFGYGLFATTANFSKGIIPHKLTAKIGGAFAASTVQPKDGGYIIGTEVNGNMAYNFGPFMSLELHAAYLSLGDFYDSNESTHGSDINGLSDTRPVNPWTAFIVFKWLLF